jgi:hypothetical protein
VYSDHAAKPSPVSALCWQIHRPLAVLVPLLRVWVHCLRASNGLLPRRSNPVGYVQWDARFDQFLLVRQSLQQLYRSQPTIETGIGPRVDLLDALGQGRDHPVEMARDLLPIGAIAIAQFSPNVLVGSARKVSMG